MRSWMEINVDITKMSDPQANHYEATTDINAKLMEAMEARMTEGALQPSHFYTSYLPGKVGFLTFLPESYARILLEHIRIAVVPSSACTYRLTARVSEICPRCSTSASGRSSGRPELRHPT